MEEVKLRTDTVPVLTNAECTSQRILVLGLCYL